MPAFASPRNGASVRAARTDYPDLSVLNFAEATRSATPSNPPRGSLWVRLGEQPPGLFSGNLYQVTDSEGATSAVASGGLVGTVCTCPDFDRDWSCRARRDGRTSRPRPPGRRARRPGVTTSTADRPGSFYAPMPDEVCDRDDCTPEHLAVLRHRLLPPGGVRPPHPRATPGPLQGAEPQPGDCRPPVVRGRRGDRVDRGPIAPDGTPVPAPLDPPPGPLAAGGFGPGSEDA